MVKRNAQILLVLFTLILLAWGGWIMGSRYVAKQKLEDLGVSYSESVFFQHICYGKTEIALLFLQSGMGANIKGPNDITPLHCAVMRNDKDLIKKLISDGANVNENTKSGTPLIAALRRDNISAVIVLLENNADPNIKDIYNNTVLHAIAPNQNSLVFAESFVNMGVDINAKNIEDKTPLHIAVKSGSVESIERLISLGADLNIESKYGSPLVDALNNKKLVQLLLSAGADPNTSNKDGTTPLILSAKLQDTSIPRILLDAGADPHVVAKHWGTALHAAVRSGRLETAKLFLMHGIDVDAVNCCGNNQTALHNAATYENTNSVEMIDMLIGWGGNINARGVAGRSPLIEARSNSRKLVERLISKGANVNDRDDRGYSVLWWYTNRRSLAVDVLVNNGARLDLKNKKDQEAIDLMKKEYPRLVGRAIERR